MDKAPEREDPVLKSHETRMPGKNLIMDLTLGQTLCHQRSGAGWPLCDALPHQPTFVLHLEPGPGPGCGSKSMDITLEHGPRGVLVAPALPSEPVASHGCTGQVLQTPGITGIGWVPPTHPHRDCASWYLQRLRGGHLPPGKREPRGTLQEEAHARKHTHTHTYTHTLGNS